MTSPRPHPFYFGAPGGECFGWLHAPRAQTRTDLGLVICSPFGDEDQSTHRGLRRLALVMAEAGVATLRFDHHGAGDSPGADAEHDHPSSWLRSVHAAIDTLRERTGVTRICVLGVRLGVLPAAQAASEREDVCALVALAPMLSGRGFLREALLRSAQPPLGAHDDFELGGHVVSARARAELAVIDLTGLPRPPAADVLVVEAETRPANERWLARLGTQGARTEALVCPTLTHLLEGHADARSSQALIARLAGWIGARAAPALNTAPAWTWPAASAQVSSTRETPLTLRADTTDLFGILHAPEAGAARRCVVLLNTGAARRVGPSRLYVNWARRWACDGVAVLRLDLPGLGDSEVQSGETEGEVYAIDTTNAIAAAVVMLRARFGPVECQLLGICSGAYHAYRAAVAGVEIESVVLINQATYRWDAGMRLEQPSLALRVANVRHLRERRGASRPRSASVLHAALHEVKWRGLLAAAVVWGALRDTARALGLPLPHDVGAALQSLARRKVAIHVVVADDDSAGTLLRMQAGRSVAALQKSGDLQLDVVKGADHIFTSRAARVRVGLALDRIVHRRASQAPASAATVAAGLIPGLRAKANGGAATIPGALGADSIFR